MIWKSVRPSLEIPALTITPSPPNLTLSCPNAGLFRVPRSFQIKIRLLSGWGEKRDSWGRRILRHSFLHQCTCSVAHSLRSRRQFSANLTHTISWRAYRPTAWRQFWTVFVEILVPVAERRFCRRRVAFMFWCLRAVNVKLRSSMSVVARIRPCPDPWPAFPVSKILFQILEITLCATQMASACVWLPPSRPTTLQASNSVKWVL